MELYKRLEEKGYKIEAYAPRRYSESHDFLVRAYKGKKLIKEINIPIQYFVLTGTDARDKQRLDDKIKELIESLS